MTPAFRVFAIALSAIFWLGLTAAMAAGYGDPFPALRDLAPLFGFAILAEAMTVGQNERGAGILSFSAAAHIAVAVVFGPVPAALVAGLAVILVDGIRTLEPRHVVANSAMFGLSIWTAAEIYVLLGGTLGGIGAGDLLPLVALIAVRFLVNSVIYAVGVWSASGRFALTLRDEIRDGLGAATGEGSLGVLVAFAYADRAWVILPFLLPLLVALYNSRSNFERLRAETANVLNCLARVIDERDPSTAQHSERVAQYVERFVAAIGLSERESERLVDAAKFHDLGKVVVDVATLSKNGRLTESELRAIRQHPRLSARLLTPFHFAQEMALYAELHHERYDGRGYYAVPQREIPVEAHVLIVADSFDAMTSARAYRPALTVGEAVQELRDKSGTQFHPLVAAAFVAMIEGKDVEPAMGAHQLAALRAEFSRIPVVSMPSWRNILTSSALAVAMVATALITFGATSIPRWVDAGVLGIAFLSGFYWAAGMWLLARRRARVSSSIEAGCDPSAAMKQAGVTGWASWLDWDVEMGMYVHRADAAQRLSGDDLQQACSRALRSEETRVASLQSGVQLVLAAGTRGEPRLMAVLDTAPSKSDVILIELAAELARARADRGDEPLLSIVPGPGQRHHLAAGEPAVAIVELNAFEEVRIVAGQLSAERVVADAEARLRAQLRDEDLVVRLSDDGFGVLCTVADRAALEALCDRLQDGIAEVPVPRRARQLSPHIRASLARDAASDPELAALLAQLLPPEHAERAAS